jgi:glutamate formiminotransferase/formiminotetrahydrofolate cyclodeaminase
LKTIAKKLLVKKDLVDFAETTASEFPAPGGGSVSAYVGALGVSLGTMVANLSAHKRGWDDKWEMYSDWAVKGQQLKNELIRLVDEDTNAFNKIMDAFGLPKDTDEQKAKRKQAIEDATKYAIEIPLAVMKASHASLELIAKMVEIGLPSSISDAGVGALCVRTAVTGAYLNVRINAVGLADKAYAEAKSKEAIAIREETDKIVDELVKKVEEKM